MMTQPEPLDPQLYARVFEGHAEAVMVLDELVRVFGRDPWVRGGQDGARETDRNWGSLRVINFINAKINAAHGVVDFDSEELIP